MSACSGVVAEDIFDGSESRDYQYGGIVEALLGIFESCARFSHDIAAVPYEISVPSR